MWQILGIGSFCQTHPTPPLATCEQTGKGPPWIAWFQRVLAQHNMSLYLLAFLLLRLKKEIYYDLEYLVTFSVTSNQENEYIFCEIGWPAEQVLSKESLNQLSVSILNLPISNWDFSARYNSFLFFINFPCLKTKIHSKVYLSSIEIFAKIISAIKKFVLLVNHTI